MIKPIVINKIGIIIFSLLILLLGFLLHANMLVIILLLALAIYLRFKTISTDYHTAHLLLKLSLLFLVIFTLSDIAAREKWQIYYIPFCALPMLTVILFNSLEMGFLISVAGSVAVASLYGDNLNLNILFLISGISSSMLSFNARKRMDVIRVGFFTGLIQSLSLLLINRFIITDPLQYVFLVINGIACGVIVVGFLPLFEHLFGTVTNVSLLELADFNHPLLQRMILEAPGTYHHSLVVGNLSDAACKAVGANSLLARIGAYYHDIGKIEKAEYFSENQNLEESKHDSLSPTISKLVIINHVKEGMELAKKYRLNSRIIDFITQHHGNSLVYYFYRRALEGLEEDEEIKEEGFRYPGPKPKTKETAIVLLADSVEAATRALKEVSPAKIGEVVHKIINNKFIDGQLDECDLTLKDLEKIASIFIRILSGIYHSRVAYPEKNLKSESNHKKSAKESSHQSGRDKKDSS